MLEIFKISLEEIPICTLYDALLMLTLRPRLVSVHLIRIKALQLTSSDCLLAVAGSGCDVCKTSRNSV